MLQVPLCLDALFEHLKHSANKPSPRRQSKVTLHRPNSITKANSEYVNDSFMLCTAFEERDMHRVRIFFETIPFCHAYTNLYRSLKDFNLLQNLHLYTQNSVCATST